MGTIRLGDVVNKKTNTIDLVDWQMAFVASEARYKVAVCGRRSGKTTAASTLIYVTAVEQPGAEIWAVAKTYAQAKKLYFTELQKLFPRRFIKNINRSELSIELINGSLITLKGANNPDSLLGSGLDLLIIDEYQSQDPELLDYLTPMLSDRFGKLVLIGTPRGYNHLYEAFQQGRDTPGWFSIKVTTEEAGVIPEEEIQAAKERMDEKMFEQEFNASFENMLGLVYYAFSMEPGGNVKPLQEFKHLPLWVGLDFNVDNMNAVVLQTPIINGKQEAHFIDEIQLTYQADTVKMIKEIKTRYPNRNIIICPDASGRNRNSGSAEYGSSNHTLLKQAGFPIKFQHGGNPYIEDRVVLQNSLIKNANGIRRLFVDPKCKNIIKFYTQRPYEKGIPLKDGKVDHMADAADYALWETFAATNSVQYGRMR
jgi:hypothetical protein